MGIESDQVVYEYLSRVGDVAQQRQLPSATRMRLVSELRNEIDRRRARVTVDSPAAVRRILDRLGSPDDIVTAAGGTAAAGGTDAAVPPPPAAAVPVQRDAAAEQAARAEAAERGGGAERAKDDRPRGLRRMVPRPRPARPEPDPAPPAGPAPPHLASPAELGSSATVPDWWRTETGPFGIGDEVPGFVGGVEIPDLLKPPPPREPAQPAGPAPAPAADRAEETAPAGEAAARRRLLPRLPTGGWSNPLLLLAAGLLVLGAVLGTWFALLLGWVIAYASRRLTPREAKWAVAGMPGLAVAAGVVWLWGRANGRWGAPLAQGHLNEAVGETWPWVVRAAAVLSALFLVWRSQRRR